MPWRIACAVPGNTSRYRQMCQPQSRRTSCQDDLSQCLPRVLSELSAEDRLAITLCDIEGHSQQVLAERLGISLPGAKSRIQRARLRLREQLVTACKVSFDDNGEVCCFVPRPAIGE